MALQTTLTDHYGITHAEAYARICAYRFDWLAGEGVVSVQFFVNAAARQADKQPIRTWDYKVTESGGRPALYTQLKQHADFQGATDI